MRALLLLLVIATSSVAQEKPPLTREPSPAAMRAATREGKYADLLKVLEVPGDLPTYGDFHDWGWWGGTSWAGQTVPPGYWVYVYPHWFVFKTQRRPVPPESTRPF